jgi:hypothetical protein
VNDFRTLYAYEVERLLRKVHKTTPGKNQIPYWVFSHCLYELAEVVAHIYNCSLRSGFVPDQWLPAVITPVPKEKTDYSNLG